MSKTKGKADSVRLTAVESIVNEPVRGWFRSHLVGIGAFSFGLLLVLGIFASNGWLPRTDTGTGKRTGWFGRPAPKNAVSNWNPFAPPDPTPTPQLSKEYIYAGSRLLAVEDANASAIPPDDLAVWRPSNGTWYILGSQQTPPIFGQSGDTPVQGDFDGDGKTDFAVRRPGIVNPTWYVLKSSDNTFYGVPFGYTGDTPAVADYDGDGKTDIAVWRPSTQCWYIQQSSTNMTLSPCFGQSGDIPAPADYDGDGRADIGVWRDSDHTFNSVNSSNGASASLSWGLSGDKPVCADYEGDGKADYAVFRPSNATWYIRRSSDGQMQTVQYGLSGDTLVPNDYDGDGKCDIAVWRVSAAKGNPAFWYILQSHDGSTRTVQWGTTGDIPVPALYRR